MNDICPQLLWVIIYATLEDGIEHPNQLAARCDDGLIALKRILPPGREVFIHITELGVALNHGQHDLKQNLPQLFSARLLMKLLP